MKTLFEVLEDMRTYFGVPVSKLKSLGFGRKVVPVYMVNPAPEFDGRDTLTVAAVQNTKYTVFETTDAGILWFAGVKMATLAEDIEIIVTIDGVEKTAAKAGAVAGTAYWGFINPESNALLSNSSTVTMFGVGNGIPYRSCKVEIQKTTANGANNLSGYVQSSSW